MSVARMPYIEPILRSEYSSQKMKKNIKIQEKVVEIVGIGLSLWLIAGFLGFWTLLPQNKFWTIIKVVSGALLLFVLIIHTQGAENETFKEQITLIGKILLGAVGLFVVGAVLYIIINSGGVAGCNYPWSTGCP